MSSSRRRELRALGTADLPVKARRILPSLLTKSSNNFGVKAGPRPGKSVHCKKSNNYQPLAKLLAYLSTLVEILANGRRLCRHVEIVTAFHSWALRKLSNTLDLMKQLVK